MAQTDTATVKAVSPIPNDIDPAETAEWLESLDYVLERKGPERAQQLLTALEEAAIRNGVELPFTATTPYVNTIPADKQPRYQPRPCEPPPPGPRGSIHQYRGIAVERERTCAFDRHLHELAAMPVITCKHDY